MLNIVYSVLLLLSIAMPKRKQQESFPSIVGPDCIQVLNGNLFGGGKDVSIVLCGESHQDSMDVTRRGGRFDGKEGWIKKDNIMKDDEVLLVHVFATSRKLMPLEKAKDWAKNLVEEDPHDDMSYINLVLVWCEDQQGGRVTKGKAFLVGITTDDEEDDDDDPNYWKQPNDSSLPLPVRDWTLEKSRSKIKVFEWGDLDAQAFALNKRRLTDEDISTEELDGIIRQRKENIKELDNIWTWDEWLNHMMQEQEKTDTIDIHLILEASVVPWELSLHRPTVDEDVTLGRAADCIRSVEEDEEGDEEDDVDPSSDGIGSYLDFIYRTYMEKQLEEHSNAKEGASRSWLHCVDSKYKKALDTKMHQFSHILYIICPAFYHSARSGLPGCLPFGFGEKQMEGFANERRRRDATPIICEAEYIFAARTRFPRQLYQICS